MNLTIFLVLSMFWCIVQFDGSLLTTFRFWSIFPEWNNLIHCWRRIINPVWNTLSWWIFIPRDTEEQYPRFVDRQTIIRLSAPLSLSHNIIQKWTGKIKLAIWYKVVDGPSINKYFGLPHSIISSWLVYVQDTRFHIWIWGWFSISW